MGVLDFLFPKDPEPIQGGDKKIEKKPTKGFTQLNNEIRDFLKADPSTRSIKDFNTLFGDISYYNAQGGYKGSGVNISPEVIKQLQNALNAQYPNRGKDDLTQPQIMRSPFFEGFREDSKGNIVPKPFEESDVTLAVARGNLTKDIKEAIEEANKPYEGPFGKLGEYFSKNADKREELFDQLSSIGQRLVQPTKPGEARSFVRDLVEGSAAGERKTMAKASAEAEADYKRALAGQADRPDNTTAYDNAYTIVKGQGKFKEGTPEFASAIAKMMTFITASPALTALNKQLSDLQASLKRATNDQEKASIANQIASTKSQINALTGGTGLGTSESATSVYDSTKKNKKDEKL
jgi:hypothetical protein